MLKPDQVRIVSVKHTGTNFVDLLLKDSGFGAVSCSHWTTEDLDDKRVIISPLRDPHATYVTWYSRGRFGPAFFSEWKLLNTAWETGKALVLPVDADKREEQIAKVEDTLGIDLKTDWAPVEHMTRYIAPAVDLSWVYDLPIVKEFYGN